MMNSLHIENIAVIKNIDIEFNNGFTVLTGETGAGKSIIIDSINLLLGTRPSREIIRSGEKYAMVSALFTDISPQTRKSLEELGINIDDDSLLLQRNITIDGKAQTKLNGRYISVTLQKEVSKYLFNIHGQHDNQSLLQANKHILLLDEYTDLQGILTCYVEYFTLMNETKSKILSLTKNEQEKTRLIELLKYQIADIESAKLKDNEEDILLSRRVKIQNIEKILKQVKIVYKSLYKNDKGIPAFEMIGKAISSLEQIVDVIPDKSNSINSFIEKLSSFQYEIEDIALSVKEFSSEEDGDPTALLNKIEYRLDTIHQLKRKYGTTIAEILDYKNKIVVELEDNELSDEKISKLQLEYNNYEENAKEYANILTQKRKEAAKVLETKIMEELSYLDMMKVRFTVMIKHCIETDGGVCYARRGVDDVEFMISTNLGEPLKPLSKIASGGELSRIMLAIKSVLADKESTETIIFDEIDTGVSGKTSQKIGVKLKQIANNCQVICVTHSAQIAALAHNHLLINKSELNGRVETSVAPLQYNGKIDEIARIMGGIHITDTVLETAKEMLETSKNY